jgi:hypothetical protein
VIDRREVLIGAAAAPAVAAAVPLPVPAEEEMLGADWWDEADLQAFERAFARLPSVRKEGTVEA